MIFCCTLQQLKGSHEGANMSIMCGMPSSASSLIKKNENCNNFPPQ